MLGFFMLTIVLAWVNIVATVLYRLYIIKGFSTMDGVRTQCVWVRVRHRATPRPVSAFRSCSRKRSGVSAVMLGDSVSSHVRTVD
jgi:hypothetical protein